MHVLFLRAIRSIHAAQQQVGKCYFWVAMSQSNEGEKGWVYSLNKIKHKVELHG
jgi:hypothetical protein